MVSSDPKATRQVAAPLTLGLAVAAASVLSAGSMSEQPKGFANPNAPTNQLTPTPTLSICAPTPTAVTPSNIPDRYGIFLTRDAAQNAPLAAAQLAQMYGLTEVSDVEQGDTSFSAIVPPSQVATLQSDPRVRGIDQARIVPIPFEYLGPPCITPTPTSTPSGP